MSLAVLGRDSLKRRSWIKENAGNPIPQLLTLGSICCSSVIVRGGMTSLMPTNDIEMDVAANPVCSECGNLKNLSGL